MSFGWINFKYRNYQKNIFFINFIFLWMANSGRITMKSEIIKRFFWISCLMCGKRFWKFMKTFTRNKPVYHTHFIKSVGEPHSRWITKDLYQILGTLSYLFFLFNIPNMGSMFIETRSVNRSYQTLSDLSFRLIISLNSCNSFFIQICFLNQSNIYLTHMAVRKNGEKL